MYYRPMAAQANKHIMRIARTTEPTMTITQTAVDIPLLTGFGGSVGGPLNR
jgi:hypothetical protein